MSEIKISSDSQIMELAKIENPAVLNRIRMVLANYRSSRLGEQGKELSWVEFAAEIELHYETIVGEEATLPSNVLQFCVRGQPHRNPEKKSRGIRQYSKPEPDQLDMLVRFLTDEDSPGYFCSKIELYSVPALQAPTFLLSFLSKDSSPDQHTQSISLEGQYTTLPSEPATPIDLEIHFLNGTHSGAVVLDLIRHDNEQGDSSSYSGWGVISPEQLLLLYVQEQKRIANYYYVSLGLGNPPSFKDAKPPTTIAVIEHNSFLNNLDIDPDNDTQGLVQELQSVFENGILILNRQ